MLSCLHYSAFPFFVPLNSGFWILYSNSSGGERAPGQHDRDFPPVAGRSVHIRWRIDLFRGELGGGGEGFGGGLLADQRGLGARRAGWPVAATGVGKAGGRDRAVGPQGQHRGDANDREIAVPARQLFEAAAGSLGQARNAHAGEDLVGLERCGEDGLKKSPAEIARSPAGLVATIVASSATATQGSSETGSPWARLPPTVPRLRIAGWPM